jgi:pimeloyl-ACP methyl ester carboxylesterase
MEPFTSSVRGLRFTGFAAGPVDGPPVLLLHGFPEFAECWLPLMGMLSAAGYRAVAFDQRGYSDGARPEGVAEYAVDELVADTLAMADHHFPGAAFHLVGHDWGGAVAWACAAAAPDRLRTLTVLSTPHPAAMVEALADPASDQRRRSRYIGYFRRPDHVAEQGLLANDAAVLYAAHVGLDRGHLERTVTRLAADGGAALTGGLNWYRAIHLARPVGPVRIPTLYLWGSDDEPLGRDPAARTAAHVEGDYRFVTLAGGGHWLPELESERILPDLLRHLGGAK